MWAKIEKVPKQERYGRENLPIWINLKQSRQKNRGASAIEEGGEEDGVREKGVKERRKTTNGF